jgi:hypothetical protein
VGLTLCLKQSKGENMNKKLKGFLESGNVISRDIDFVFEHLALAVVFLRFGISPRENLGIDLEMACLYASIFTCLVALVYGWSLGIDYGDRSIRVGRYIPMPYRHVRNIMSISFLSICFSWVSFTVNTNSYFADVVSVILLIVLMVLGIILFSWVRLNQKKQ